MEIECGTHVRFDGEEHIAVFTSSPWAQRGFCKHCGSHVYMKMTVSGDYGIPPGLFSNDDGIQFNRQVFFDKKPTYYGFSNATRNITSETIYRYYPETKEDND